MTATKGPPKWAYQDWVKMLWDCVRKDDVDQAVWLIGNGVALHRAYDDLKHDAIAEQRWEGSNPLVFCLAHHRERMFDALLATQPKGVLQGECEHAWIQAVRMGNERAFEKLLERHEPHHIIWKKALTEAITNCPEPEKWAARLEALPTTHRLGTFHTAEILRTTLFRASLEEGLPTTMRPRVPLDTMVTLLERLVEEGKVEPFSEARLNRQGVSYAHVRTMVEYDLVAHTAEGRATQWVMSSRFMSLLEAMEFPMDLFDEHFARLDTGKRRGLEGWRQAMGAHLALKDMERSVPKTHPARTGIRL